MAIEIAKIKPCGLPFRQNRKIKYQEGMLILVLEFWTMLYQKRRKKGEAPGEIWTLDPWFTRPVLYPWATEACGGGVAFNFELYLYLKDTNDHSWVFPQL